MEHRFSDLLSSQKLVRDMEDWLGGAESEEEAIDMLEIFLARCEQNNIVLAPKKFQWGDWMAQSNGQGWKSNREPQNLIQRELRHWLK